jgi:hypothetical protein
MPRLKLLFGAIAMAFASLCVAEPSSNAAARFVGSAQLSAPAGISADGRFRLDAALMQPSTLILDPFKPKEESNPVPTPKVDAPTSARFGLDAHLFSTARSKGFPVACDTDATSIFKNGFEN